MGLLDQTNPNATSRSVAAHAIGWGVVAIVAYYIACIWYPSFREGWFIKLPGCILFGAAVGGLMEWQLDDADDEGDA
jgi:hypothetical protein